MARKKKVVNTYYPPVVEQQNPNIQVCSPTPRAVTPNVVTALPNSNNYNPCMQTGITGLPYYTATDEYGRVYRVNLMYGPQPCSGPVPVARPCELVQTTPIVAPTQFNR